MEKNPDKIGCSIQTLCKGCGRPISGTYMRRGNAVFLESSCPEHGGFSVLASEYADDFEHWQTYSSITVPPKQALTKSGGFCPLSCGTCEDHLMTACCVLIDVTDRCNQHCPWCFASAGMENAEQDPSLQDLERKYSRLIELGEERPFNIQLSGGEPTVRDDLPEIVAMGRGKGFEYIQLNTNGRRLAEDAAYAKSLADAGLSSVFMQFDGMNDDIYMKLRGEPLLGIKLAAINNCALVGLPVTLVPTILKDVNLSHVGKMFRFLLDNLNVVKGIHFQPASFFGRHPGASDMGDKGNSSVDRAAVNASRVTMFALMREIERQTEGAVSRENLVPISTGHPLCCFCGSFLRERDGSISSLVTDDQKASGASCCCAAPIDSLEIIKKDRNFVLNKWTVKSSDNEDMGQILSVDECEGINQCSPKQVSASCCPPSLDEELERIRSNMFTLSGMAFMDASNLDAERLKRCRVQYFTDDEKLIPFCAYNSLYRC